MPTLIMAKGLPASGKTTWAREQVNKYPDKYRRVNKDNLRDMIICDKWSREREEAILANRDMLIVFYLNRGFDVIVDDTNLAPKHEKLLREIADFHKTEFEIKDFTDVSVEECIKRDSKRPNYVGEKVIKSMYNSFLRPKVNVAQYKHNPDLPTCILVDIDGTLAHMAGRSPFEWHRVGEDSLDEVVKGIILKEQLESVPGMKDTYTVLLSGRDAVCRPETEKWLEDNAVPYDELHMRPEGDSRKDTIIKQELFDNYIRNRYNVKFVLDDRDRVVKMWRNMGLKVLQVAEGDF